MTEDAHYQGAREAGDLQRCEDASLEQRRDWVEERTGEMRSTIEREQAIGRELIKARLAIEAAKEYAAALQGRSSLPMTAIRPLELLAIKIAVAASAIERALARHNGE